MITFRFAARTLPLAALLAAPALSPHAAVAADAAAQVTAVTGRPMVGTRALATGGVVSVRDTVSTGAKGQVVLRFTDDTALSLGANTAITIEDFSPGGAGAPAVVRAARGTFRFASGRSGPEAYRVETPAATLGASGATLDARVDSGRMQVAVTQGSIVVCPQRGRPEFADCVDATAGQTVIATATTTKVVATETAPALRVALLPLAGSAAAGANAGAVQAVGGAVKAVSTVGGVFNSLTTKVLGATGKAGGAVLNGTVGEAVKPPGGYSDDPVLPEVRPED